ncbi:MAG: 4Fe-4S binding protein [Anaerolineae bacterium]|nr:4Fe-4S binding protein [Anaerolineae bacterium]NUQ05661.1 4Fe-4S binding protein [Anaerolineae bacterium]
MSYMITSECINCSACEMECPVRAITAGPSQYVINPNVCIECQGYYPEARCKWACPVDACVPERSSYQFRSASLTNRGAPPVVLTADHPTGVKRMPIEVASE